MLNNKDNENQISKKVLAIIIISVGCIMFILLIGKVIFDSFTWKNESNRYIVFSDNDTSIMYDNGLLDSKKINDNDDSKGRVIFQNNRVKTSSWGGHCFATIDFEKIETGELFVLEFSAYTKNMSPVLLNLNYGSSKKQIEIGQNQYRYYVPFLGNSNVESILMQFEISQGIEKEIIFSDFCVVDYGIETMISEVKTGRYLLDDYELIQIDADEEKEFFVDGQAVAENKGYVYIIDKGTLHVIKTGSFLEVGNIKGLGEYSNLYLLEEKQLILVTSRGSGAFLVDISKPSVPQILCHYDTLESVMGAAVYGDYMFLCDRFFGIEIVTISNPREPQYITTIRSDKNDEIYECSVSNGFLYATTHGNKTVEIYDVRELDAISNISTINLDGWGMGLTVQNGILYVATAKDATLYSDGDGFDNLKIGSGSGLEIYNVDNPDKPVLLSREKADGRSILYPGNQWDVYVEGNYAYVSLMCDGMIIYDISNPNAPKRLKVINVTCKRDSDMFTEYDKEHYLMPFLSNEENYEGIIKAFPGKGALYCVTDKLGIFKINTNLTYDTEAHFINGYVDGDILKNGTNHEKSGIEELSTQDSTVQQYFPNEEIYAIDELSDKKGFVIACGKNGIKVVDTKMKVIASYSSGYPVKDVRTKGDYIYTAESTGGIAIYSFNKEEQLLTELGRVMDSTYNVYMESMEISDDELFIVAQAGNGIYRLIDIRDKENPSIILHPFGDGTGTMLFRNVCVGTLNNKLNNKYVGIGGNKAIKWFSAYSSDEKLVVQCNVDESGALINESTGFASTGDQYLITSGLGYKVIDQKTNEISSEIIVDGEFHGGKCSVYKNTLVVCHPWEGDIWIIDIGDINNPIVKEKIRTNCITDVPYITDGAVYVPCRHDGLLCINY